MAKPNTVNSAEQVPDPWTSGRQTRVLFHALPLGAVRGLILGAQHIAGGGAAGQWAIAYRAIWRAKHWGTRRVGEVRAADQGGRVCDGTVARQVGKVP